MKTNIFTFLGLTTLGLISCNTSSSKKISPLDISLGDEAVLRGDNSSSSDAIASQGTKSGIKVEAGVLTAGAWSDLENWDFWNQLMQTAEYYNYLKEWKFNLSNRYSVQVFSEDELISIKTRIYFTDISGIDNISKSPNIFTK